MWIQFVLRKIAFSLIQEGPSPVLIWNVSVSSMAGGGRGAVSGFHLICSALPKSETAQFLRFAPPSIYLQPASLSEWNSRCLHTPPLPEG